jgi:hypothetical protein
VTLQQKHQTELNKICDGLREAIASIQPEECQEIVSQALRRAERLAESLASAPAKLGAKGGKKTAALMTAKDPDYFKKLAAMRKTKAGGRPKSEQ